MPSYSVPAAPVEVTEEIKGSQFITRLAQVVSVEKAKAFIRDLNENYPDATHHCWAYIVGDPDSTTLIGCSDDGEPSGTAGKPMLNILQHAKIGDIVAVCTRYYGGTKLGTGGLMRAYSGGVKLALQDLQITDKVAFKTIQFEIDYSQQKDCEHLLKEFLTENVSFEFASNISVSIDIAVDQLKEFQLALQNQFKGKIEWTVISS